jgi:hypothetical protein
LSLRAEVYALDDGRCVGCGKRLARGGTLWDWVPHHCILEQVLKARGLRPKWWRGPALCILLCFDCHGRQHNRKAPVPLERLPERVHRSVAILGPWATDLLARYHPPT